METIALQIALKGIWVWIAWPLFAVFPCVWIRVQRDWAEDRRRLRMVLIVWLGLTVVLGIALAMSDLH